MNPANHLDQSVCLRLPAGARKALQQIAAVLNLPQAYFYCEDDKTTHLLQCFHCLKGDDRKRVLDLAESLAFNH
jgi:hypothetical protein